MIKNKKYIILILLFILIFGIISSSFIANDINHINHCNKKECDTCKIIIISKFFLNTLLSVVLIYLIKLKYIKLILYRKYLKKYIKKALNTLIALKVQFNA